MTEILAGANVERPPGKKYLKALPFAELVFTTGYPKIGSLTRWRESAPELEVAVVAPHGARKGKDGFYRFDADLSERFEWLMDAARALRAHLVIPTGAELSTSKRDRERFRAYVGRVREEITDHQVVWAPGGIWEDEIAHPFAADLGVLCAFDPLEDAAPAGDVAYARVRAVGARQRLSEGVLFDLVDRLLEAEYQRAYVALESPRSFQEATRLAALAAEG